MYRLDLSAIEQYACKGKRLELNDDLIHQIEASFSFLKEFSSDKIIYGINTGFGPMAQFKIDRVIDQAPALSHGPVQQAFQQIIG